jgi:YfiH family protein
MKLIERELPGAKAVFSTRLGGVSEGPYESLNLGILTDDDQERVAQNRGRLAEAAGIESERIAMGWQVHGTDLREWEAPPDGGGFAQPGAELDRVDGHLTHEPGVGLLVLVADCLPVALANRDQAAMLHCGWRGLAGGLVEKAVERFDDAPSAVIGPGIGGCCYEVGPEVLEAFGDLDGVAHGRMLDLKAVARQRLEAAGVTEIDDVDLCTSCHPELFFSHRRDNGVTGRQGGLAWLTSPR